MGAPVFLGHWLYTLHSRVLPNWIAPAVLPMACLMVVYWEQRWAVGTRAIGPWLFAGLCAGYITVIFALDSDLGVFEVKYTGRTLR